MITTLPDSKTFVIDDIIEDNAQAEVTLIETAIEDIGDIDRVRRPVARHPAGQLHHLQRRQGRRQRHPHRAGRALPADSQPHRRPAVQVAGSAAAICSAPSPAASRSWPSLDISERRLPQDGRVHVLLDGRKIDLRVQHVSRQPRRKDRDPRARHAQRLAQPRDLGFAEDMLTPLQSAIQAPNGIVLVTGPTGSGKSTTLYAALNEIASMENNICTVEDPIEYHLPLINQFQVQEQVGLTFSKALRTLLRQDPDVIMVGEIRDEETARTAIQAALTGHLVFSTLHTNDAASAITRLINMGVEPYLIGAALNVVLAQRLVRRICAKCREEYEPPRPLRKAIERMGYRDREILQGRRLPQMPQHGLQRPARRPRVAVRQRRAARRGRRRSKRGRPPANRRHLRHDHAPARRLSQSSRRADEPGRSDSDLRRRERHVRTQDDSRADRTAKCVTSMTTTNDK